MVVAPYTVSFFVGTGQVLVYGAHVTGKCRLITRVLDHLSGQLYG